MVAPDPRQYLLQQVLVMRRADRDVLAALQKARQDINRMLRELRDRPGTGAMLRASQLQLVKRNILLEQAKLWRQIGDIVQARRQEAAARLIDLNKQLDAFKLAAAGLPDAAAIADNIAQAELDAAGGAMDRMIARMNGASYTPLKDRVYKSQVGVNGRISRLIDSAIARGLSAREFAREISDFINPNTPGGVRYAAFRTARTEINNAAHAVAVNAVADKPWVEEMKWKLSSSHPRPDECDRLAHGGHKGDGLYPKGEVPSKPHPHCFCFVTPVTPTDDEFLDNLLGGKYNDYLERYSPGISARNPKGFLPPSLKSVKAKATVREAEAHVDKLTSKLPARGGIAVAAKQALNTQARVAPASMMRFKEIRMMSAKDLVDLGHPNSVAGYWPSEFRMSVADSIFTSAGDAVALSAVKQEWWCQATGSGANMTISHEYGHHIHNLFRNAPAARQTELWRVVSQGLGVAPPQTTLLADTNAWVALNATRFKRLVSEYGSSSTQELLAEIWAEFSTNPNARPGIKLIGQAMLELAEESA